MKLKSLKKFFTITLPTLVVILILLEIVFRTIIPASTHPFFEMVQQDQFTIGKYNHLNGKEGIKTYGPFGVAKSKWKINNEGWNSDIDYNYTIEDSSKLRVAVIGDSYVEALNVLPNESITAIIRSNFANNATVYSFGIGGSPLTQYLHFSRYAKQYFDPDVYVIVATNNDFDESLINYGDTRNLLFTFNEDGIAEIPPFYREITNSKFRRLAKNSALLRYLFYNLQITRFTRFIRISSDKNGNQPETASEEEIISDANIKMEDQDSISTKLNDEFEEEIISDANIKVENQDSISTNSNDEFEEPKDKKQFQPPKNVINPGTIFSSNETIKYVADYVIKEMSQNCKGKKVIIVNDGQRTAIYKGKSTTNEFQKAFRILGESIVDTNMIHIDLHQVFKQDYEKNGLKFNSAIDYHWNQYGHQVVADTLYKSIKEYSKN